MKNHHTIYQNLFIAQDQLKLRFLTPIQATKALECIQIIRTESDIKQILQIAELPSKLIMRDFLRLCYIVENSEQHDLFKIIFLANDHNYRQRVSPETFRKLKNINCKCDSDSVTDICTEIADLENQKYISYELFMCVCEDVFNIEK
ncbi:hypothetical protein SS50377_20852 [Spironucleus salmonicida]|uniref:Uncharacterized protein n=1 Tax=Spironucleus salmonicida TaxID=348837 RepID=V6LG48_9EUKA|nr:hypothetical protein SS50377_20852 [Spironucleus salmonicida]|eukprot:EST43530.1 Hypothetical protein SS50377_16565 [Spironucleus salmonicida]